MAALDREPDGFSAVRSALGGNADSDLWSVEHVDITCDGCEQEPIVGVRFKCSVCRDRDLCSHCLRALLTARVLIAQETQAPDCGASSGEADAPKGIVGSSAGLFSSRLQGIGTAVPCLDPRHRFQQVTGPERSVRHRTTGIGEHLDQFLLALPPSGASCADVAWICVDRAPTDSSRSSDGSSQAPGNGQSVSPSAEAVENLLGDWERLLAGGRRLSHADIDALALKYGVLRGKWMCFPSRLEVGAAWGCVACALAEGKLGPTAKVASCSPGATAQVICVTSEDYQDAEDVMRVRQVLQLVLPQLGDGRLLYKPDVFSILGIYARNSHGLKPTIFEAAI